MNMTVKDLVKNTTAEFICFKDGDLWYEIGGKQTTTSGSTEPFKFRFPVPAADTENGVFPARIKAITLMKWVRAHLEKLDSGEFDESVMKDVFADLEASSTSGI